MAMGAEKKTRLDKYVAQALEIPRSASREMIAKGRVTVNGQVCKKADTQLEPGADVCAGGRPLHHEAFVYLMLNKPEGVVSAAEDKQDTNPLFAGLYNSQEYRKAQTEWLKHALKQKDIASAPHIVAFCHIPLFDDDPTHNPGDVSPADKDPAYTKDFALWQRTCANMWTPLLQKAGCRVIITAHMHKYRFDAPTGSRKWAQIVGGGPKINSKNGFPTVIEGFTEGKELVIRIHNVSQGTVVAEHRFNAK